MLLKAIFKRTLVSLGKYSLILYLFSILLNLRFKMNNVRPREPTDWLVTTWQPLLAMEKISIPKFAVKQLLGVCWLPPGEDGCKEGIHPWGILVRYSNHINWLLSIWRSSSSTLSNAIIRFSVQLHIPLLWPIASCDSKQPPATTCQLVGETHFSLPWPVITRGSLTSL